jgi:outer membrane protein assembly factor BamD
MKRFPVLFVSLLFLLAGCAGSSKWMPKKTVDDKNWSAQQFYAEAKSEMNDSNYTGAIKLLESLEARYPYGKYAQQAQLEVAYAQYKDGQKAAAVAAADRFIKMHPNHENVDYAYYIKGLSNFNDNLGMMGLALDIIYKQSMSERDPQASRESFDIFKDLVTRFPDSKYAPDSIQRMKFLVNSIAMGEIHAARYYIKRKAYVAAANRAQTTLKEFPQTPATEEALYIMAKSYDALGMTDLRDDAERILRQNFPESEFLSGSDIYKTPWWRFW